MSYVLDAVMQSLNEVNDKCGCATFMLPYELDDVVVTVPKTRRGRELFRSLLLEVGRIEREEIIAKMQELGETLSIEASRGRLENLVRRMGDGD